MSLSEPIIFDDLQLIRIPVKVFGQWYVLQEVSEEAAIAYQEALVKGIEVDVDSSDLSRVQIPKVSAEGKSGLGVLLLSMCFYHATYDEAAKQIGTVGNLVGMDTLLKWPTRIVSPLADKAQQISELDLKWANPAKNPT